MTLSARLAAASLLFFGLICDASAQLAEGFMASDLTRPDGAAWQEAVGVTFDENGRSWVWERGGRVWIIDDSNPVTSAFLDISDEVGAWHDHGMLGFALHPNFNQTGFVYLLYLVDRHHLLRCNEPTSGVGAPVCDASYSAATDEYFEATIGRLTRYQAVMPAGETDFSQATAFEPASRTVLIGSTVSTGLISTSRSHVTGSLAFGTDGTLLVTTGDGSRSSNDSGSSSTIGDDKSYTQQALDDGILDAAQDVGANRSQMIDSLSGKVLRIDPISGLGVPSNPYFDVAAPDSPRSKVFGMGLRNPYRASLWPDSGSHDPADANPGKLMIGDVGLRDWEEVNIVESAGQNFGWPIFEGMNIFPGSNFGNGDIDNVYMSNPLFGSGGCTVEFFQFSDLIVQDTANTPDFPNPCNSSAQIAVPTPTFVHTRPIIAWAHLIASTKSKGYDSNGNAVDFEIDNPLSPIQGTPFMGAAVTGGMIYQSTDLPAEYFGSYFFGDYVGQWIKRIVFDQFGQPVAVSDFSAGAEIGGVVHLASNPNSGGIYFIPWTIAVKRLDYAPGGNFRPLADLVAGPTFGPSPLTTNFDAGGSTDPEGSALTFLWDFGDGNTSTAVAPQHTFTTSGIGSFNVLLTVTDSGGAQDTASVVVSPNNSPPDVSIISPVDSTEYPLSGDTTYVLLADIRDNEHATASMQCTWTVRQYHNTHFHGGPPLQGCQTQAVTTPDGCDGESYYWEFSVSVTDPAGLETTDSVRLNTPSCTGGNTVPVANGDLASVAAGGTINIAVLDNDIDDVGLLPASLVLVGPAPLYGIATVDSAAGEIVYQHTGVAGSVDTIRYRVNDTENASSNEATVVVRSIVPDTSDPSEPASFSATGIAIDQVSLVWNASTDNVGVAGYRIYRETVLVADVSGTSLLDAGLMPNTTYGYSVEAYDDAGNSSTRAIAQATTVALPSELVLPVAADSFTRNSAGNTNFGSETVVRVQKWGNSTGFARFDLSAFPTGVAASSAFLQVSADTVRVDGVISVHKILSGWNELSLTQNNQPALGPVATSFNVSSADNGQTIVIDITDLFNQLAADPGNDFGLAMTPGIANLWIDSRESGLPMQIVATPGGPPSNTAPQANAGTDFIATVAATISLGGSVLDDGLPGPPPSLTSAWSVVSGPGTVSFTNAADPTSDVSFDTTGDYVLRLSGNDGELQHSDDVSVTVVDPSLEQTFTVLQDTFTRTNAGTTNFGSELVVRVQKWGNSTGFVRFDLSPFPSGVAASSAFLELSANSVRVDGVISVHKILGDWSEFSLSGNIQPALGPASTNFSVSSADNGQTVVVDITDLFNQLVADPVNDFGIAMTPGIANLWIDSREASLPMRIIAIPGGPPSNTAPQVNAGNDQTVILPASASLSGSVVDDGLPNPPAQTAVSWNVVSGPGAVVFGSPGNSDTTASFTVPGSYVLQLTANDGEFTGSDSLLIDVIDPNVNLSPTTSAGTDFSVTVAATTALGGSVFDDGLPGPPASLTSTWSVISGPGTVNFANATDPTSDVSFDITGDYVLRLTGDDSELQQSDDVAVTVVDPSSEQTFTVVEDTFTRSTAGNTNFGSELVVRIQKWGNSTGFIRFDLSSFPSGVAASSAYLELSADFVRVDGIISLHKVLGDWDEISLSRNIQPALGPSSISFNVSSADNGQTVVVDITDLFNQLVADPANDFGIAMTPGIANLWIGSREAGLPARIVATPGQTIALSFTDITGISGTLGPDYFGGHGVHFSDIDNDGFPDFYITMNETSFGDMADLFFYNGGGNQFTEEATARGIDNFDTGSHGGVFADFDNDGDFDLFNGSYDQNRLYLNDATGVFTDRTVSNGLPARLWPTRGVAAFDMDMDGDLDIVAINGFLGSGDPPAERNEFYRNDGNAVFTAVDLEPLFSAPSGQGVTDVDFDNDGDIDLFTANRSGDVVILRNLSGTGFEIVAASSIGFSNIAGDGISFADVNNDGFLDALLDDQLYLSDQDGTFSFSASLSGPAIPYMGGFADLNLDGAVDIVFPGADFVYLNDGNGTFSASPTFAIGTTNDPRSVAFADIDNDGDIDFLYAQKFAYNILIRNDYSGPNRWLRVSLTRSNGQAGAFGARVYVYDAGELNNPAALITWREIRSQDGYMSQSDPRVTLGVGLNDFVDLRVVFVGGAETSLLNIATMQELNISE